MNLVELFIRRPVLTIVSSILILLFGGLGFTYLGVRQYPAVEPAIVTVTTNYPGSNPDIIESQITEPLEQSINGISGIRTLTSVSSEGRSNITVEFNLGIDLESAANDVRDRVSRSIRSLPPDVDPPSVAKANADSDPILFLAVQSNQRNLLQLTDFAANVIKERVQTIPGVSDVLVWGEKKYAMRLYLDPIKMAAARVTPGDISRALRTENVELPAGRLEGANTEISIRTLGRLSTEEDFNDMILLAQTDRVVRLRDVGYAQLNPENERTLLRRNGIPMVGVAVLPQPGSNQVAIADEFYARMNRMKKEFPKDIEVVIGFDSTDFVRLSIKEVQETLLISFVLVALVIFLFLRDWRSTLIPVIAMPVSLVGALFIMYVAGFSINVLTLLGLVMATGLVVDDAIVVLENIYKKIEAGQKPMEAAIVGTKEIVFAVISTTVTLAAVFLPIIFLEGLTGRLFREFAVVIAGSVLISAFVSLTLTPMMSARMLKHNENHNAFFRVTERFFVWLNHAYERALNAFLHRRWLVFGIMIGAVGLIYLGLTLVKSELAPLEDRSRLQIYATAPEGTSYEFMDKYIARVGEAMMDSIPEVNDLVSVTSPGFSGAGNSGFFRAFLVPPSQRKRTQMQIAEATPKLLSRFPAARTFVTQEPTISTSTRAGLPVMFVLQTANLDKLREYLPKFLEAARADPTFVVVDQNLKFNKPELRLKVNREKAQLLGVSVQDIASTLQLGISGGRMGFFIKDGKQYQVIGQVKRENRDKPSDLNNLYVRNTRGELVSLDNVISREEQSTPPQLYRFNRFVSATVSAGLAPGKTLGDGIAAMQRIAKTTLDDSFSTSLDGPSRDFAESASSLLFAFTLALILIYLVLAAQFESFIDPFIILLTVPLALAGALISLVIFKQTMNIFSQIGMIMLIGLVTKNAILIVEFANQLRDEGRNRWDAAREAAASRFRPILMTSLATVLGALPIALALGAGSESRVSMGIVIIAGLIFASLLTLFVIPALYTYLSRRKPNLPEDTIDGGNGHSVNGNGVTVLPQQPSIAVLHPEPLAD
jgi:multidrug efflux pump